MGTAVALRHSGTLGSGLSEPLSPAGRQGGREGRDGREGGREGGRGREGRESVKGERHYKHVVPKSVQLQMVLAH